MKTICHEKQKTKEHTNEKLNANFATKIATNWEYKANNIINKRNGVCGCG